MRDAFLGIIGGLAVVILLVGCGGGDDCSLNERTLCREGVTYWVDSCGNEGNKAGDCECGCNADFTGCELLCECQPDCGERDCGLDPVCQTSCGSCLESQTCSPLGVCEECIPDCTGKCCGSDGCGGDCPDNCAVSGETCNSTTCECEFIPECIDGETQCVGDLVQNCTNGSWHTTADCSETNQPCGVLDGTAQCGVCCGDDAVPGIIEVSGMVTDLEHNPAIVAVTALSAFHVLVGTATPLGTTTSTVEGSFTIDCFDVSSASLGLMLLTGASGTDFFPTLTNVAAYSDEADKVCIEATPPVWAMPSASVTQLDQHPLINSADGMVIGLILSNTGALIEGATVTQADGNPVDGTVIYPSADFTAFDGTATSATGIYIIPAHLNLVSLIAVADGHAFDSYGYKASTIPGHIYMVNMLAE